MLRKVPAQVALVLVSHSAIALAQEAPVVIAEQPAGVAVAGQKLRDPLIFQVRVGA